MGFKIFTWWSGQTFGTWLQTLRHGQEVGRDADGNIYFEGAGRRWVSYATDNDSSRVPPEWHLWLHKTRQDPPSAETMPVKAWKSPGALTPPARRPPECRSARSPPARRARPRLRIIGPGPPASKRPPCPRS